MKKNIGEDVKIHPTARVNVSEYLELGDRTVLNAYANIEGRSVKIGAEGWVDEYAHIGGGSCFEPQSELIIGDFFHLGKWAELNAARKVTIGSEVALGIKTVVVSHGAYLSAWDGYPVQWGEVHIGNNVWLPHAWVNPGVTIEDNTVVASGSLVTKDLKGGCLYGGVPAKLLKENCYPKVLSEIERNSLMKMILNQCNVNGFYKAGHLAVSGAVFNLNERIIEGKADWATEKVKNQLRRNGIRFRYKNMAGEYVPW